ncbi:glycosyltransferase [Nocardioides sp. BP30]|uniref:glycosyltransferase family 2 protein n=1 Tax=Nocardioides sp. BP30 TaxID=3036374 RepID=UPI0024690BA2|nr:glycosyltransferase [Nocardioides sp. BP30]WGL53698.1 glycosyltransferase [Nocardioides sp. BP30]
MPAPRFSLLTVDGTPAREAFEQTVAAVLGQVRGDWEWLLLVEPPAAGAVREDAWLSDRLAELTALDSRVVRVVTGPEQRGDRDQAPVSRALGAARGDFVVLLASTDVPLPTALEAIGRAVDGHDDVDLVYGDEDTVAGDGATGRGTYLKPDWSPERLRHLAYPGCFLAIRRTLMQGLGDLDGRQDAVTSHDLALRAGERARRVVHLPEVLHHARAGSGRLLDPVATPAHVAVVQSHLDRVGIAATARPGQVPGSVSVERQPDVDTSVSVIIPTIGSRGTAFGERRTFVVEAIRSLLVGSGHRDVEFVVVYDEPTPAEVLDELRALRARVRLVPFREEFNFSVKCNVGAALATGEVLVFLNDDTEARTPGVVENLIAPLREEGVGMTGPKLLFEDLRIQHAGVNYGDGDVFHSYYRAGPEDTGTLGDLWINREVSALTGACIAIRADLFREIGGFVESLPLNYNDVDLSLKVRRLGHRLVWLHAVELFHFESTTRVPVIHGWERRTLIERWGTFRQPELYTAVVR